LSLKARANGFSAVQSACGDRSGSGIIYDYGGDREGSEHASLYRGVIQKLHGSKNPGRNKIKLIKIDDFIKTKKIKRIHLLKIDAEGNELNVLHGAAKAIRNGKVDVLHFEFNEMNVISRTFFFDFFELLKGYRFYRMLPDGLGILPAYRPGLFEIFGYQNIVAIGQVVNWFRF
jgi:FkbM family methyltransferase